MTVAEQNVFIEAFYRRATGIMWQKGTDYAPDDVVLYDLVRSAALLEISPEMALFMLMEKHFAAVRRYAKDRYVVSEGIVDRLGDLANFAALMALLATHREQILVSVLMTLAKNERCTCSGSQCDRCSAIASINAVLGEGR